MLTIHGPAQLFKKSGRLMNMFQEVATDDEIHFIMGIPVGIDIPDNLNPIRNFGAFRWRDITRIKPKSAVLSQITEGQACFRP